MQTSESATLARIIRNHRIALGISAGELARRAGVTTGTITRLELGQISSPRAESLRSIAEALGVPASDLFVTAEWLPKNELPTFSPYLRSKYKDLPSAAKQELERSFAQVAKKYGYDPAGPAPGEDES